MFRIRHAITTREPGLVCGIPGEKNIHRRPSCVLALYDLSSTTAVKVEYKRWCLWSRELENRSWVESLAVRLGSGTGSSGCLRVLVGKGEIVGKGPADGFGQGRFVRSWFSNLQVFLVLVPR